MRFLVCTCILVIYITCHLISSLISTLCKVKLIFLLVALSVITILAFTLPLCATDDKVKISIVLNQQLVVAVAYSVTKGSPLSTTGIHPETCSERFQTVHARGFDNVIDSFVRKMESVI